MASANLPIGIIDSGLGGLTVLHALSRVFPKESFIYLGDTAHLPYGTKNKEAVTRYALTAAKFVAQKKCKLLVIGCHTASAFAKVTIQKALDIPVLGVSDALSWAASKSGCKKLCLLATRGTIASETYQKNLYDSGYSGQIQCVPAPLFVALAEEGLTTGPLAENACRHYLGASAFGCDGVILGCTHYPLLLPTLSQLYPAVTRLLDAGEACSTALLDDPSFLPCHLDAPKRITQFFFSDHTPNFAPIARRFLGYSDSSIQAKVVRLSE